MFALPIIVSKDEDEITEVEYKLTTALVVVVNTPSKDTTLEMSLDATSVKLETPDNEEIPMTLTFPSLVKDEKEVNWHELVSSKLELDVMEANATSEELAITSLLGTD
jgi:hypothetical protein